MITTILFDMDGVLINSEPVWEKVHEELFGLYKLKWDIKDYHNNIVGLNAEELFNYISKNYNLNKDKKEEFLKDRLKIFSKKEHPLFEETKLVLEKVYGNYKMALVTSTDRSIAYKIIKKKNFDKYFKAIVTGNDINKGKPNPESYLKAMEQLKSKPKECIVVEDSIKGAQAGKNSGAITIAITNTFPKEKLEFTDYQIENLDEILEIIDEFK